MVMGAFLWVSCGGFVVVVFFFGWGVVFGFWRLFLEGWGFALWGGSLCKGKGFRLGGGPFARGRGFAWVGVAL